MKNIFLSSVALLGLTVAASAADLPRRAAPTPAFVAAPVFTWTGFYVGVNAGWAFGDNGDRDTVRVVTGLPPGFAGGTIVVDSGDSDGPLGGAQIGYNMQFGTFVLGVEADIQAIDLESDRGTFTVTPVAGFPAGFAVNRTRFSSLDWFGTVRARAGFAFDRFLVYGTGGFAFGGGDDDNGCVLTTFSGTICGGDDDTRTGWALGGGVEWAWTNNLTFGVEGLWVNLDSNRHIVTATDALGRTFATTVNGDDDEFGLIRAKINFKF